MRARREPATNRNRTGSAQPGVAVFGAAGHTGRFVTAELLRRRMEPIAIARNPAALAAANFPEHRVLCRQASIDNTESLERALDGAHAVIHCAGPFLETAEAVASSALRADIHYPDVSAEQASAQAVLEKFDIPAREAEVTLVPAMGFYGGFADLLVTAALRGRNRADSIDVMIGPDSWHPAKGTRMTGQKNTARRMVLADGQLAPLPLPPAEREWEFGHPPGHPGMVEVPFSEIILISRHVKTGELHTWLSRVALTSSSPASVIPRRRPQRRRTRRGVQRSGFRWMPWSALEEKADESARGGVTSMPSLHRSSARLRRISCEASAEAQEHTRREKFSTRRKFCWR